MTFPPEWTQKQHAEFRAKLEKTPKGESGLRLSTEESFIHIYEDRGMSDEDIARHWGTSVEYVATVRERMT